MGILDTIEEPFIKVGNFFSDMVDDVKSGVKKMSDGVEGVGEAGWSIFKTTLKTSEIIVLVLVGGYFLVTLDSEMKTYKINRLTK